MNIFEKAARTKLRFDFRGSLSVEDLWDLSAEELDQYYGHLKSEETKTTTNSRLVGRKRAETRKANMLGLRIDILAHIIDTKVAEQDEAKAREENRLKKQRLAAIIAEKQEQGLKDMPLEDLQKALAELAEGEEE